MVVSTTKFSDAVPPSDGNGEMVQRLLSAFGHANALGLAICDDRLRYCEVNAALAGFNGCPAEFHLGNHLRDVIGDAAESVEVMFRRVFRTARAVLPLEIVLKLPTRTEEGHWIITYFPVRTRSGKVSRVGALSVEVTRQRELEGFLDRFQSQVHRSRVRDAHSLAQDLRASIKGYHAALAMSLAHLSRRLEDEPDVLTNLVALLDARLLNMQSLVAEVARRFPIGVQ